MPHPVLQPPPITLSASCALYCGRCGAVLSVTYQGATIGLKGVLAVIAEEQNCDGTPAAIKLVNVKPVKGKKQSALFRK